jgi:GR25 family glycosyltransferase involved in LPS biosynthesis
MILDGHYINLDRSIERRQYFEEQLRKFDLASRIQRAAAVDGGKSGPFDDPGKNRVWACRQSHELVILQSDPAAVTVVFEDDTEISPHFSVLITEESMQWFIDHNPDIDIVFLDCAFYWSQAPQLLSVAEKAMAFRKTQLHADPARHQLSTVAMLDAKGAYAHGAATYIVTPAGKRTLEGLFSAARSQPDMPIDTMFNSWIGRGKLKGRLFVPFLATPRYAVVSDIEHDLREVADPDELFWSDVCRRLLFAGDSALDFSELEARLAKSQDSLLSAEYLLGMQIYTYIHGSKC